MATRTSVCRVVLELRHTTAIRRVEERHIDRAVERHDMEHEVHVYPTPSCDSSGPVREIIVRRDLTRRRR